MELVFGDFIVYARDDDLLDLADAKTGEIILQDISNQELLNFLAQYKK